MAGRGEPLGVVFVSDFSHVPFSMKQIIDWKDNLFPHPLSYDLKSIYATLAKLGADWKWDHTTQAAPKRGHGRGTESVS